MCGRWPGFVFSPGCPLRGLPISLPLGYLVTWLAHCLVCQSVYRLAIWLLSLPIVWFANPPIAWLIGYLACPLLGFSDSLPPSRVGRLGHIPAILQVFKYGIFQRIDIGG
ncbi:hypothetical protein [Sphingobacterium multivorum]|uniref:hypothetical protein n=1 Tax=Sphingobacterium multivorum TaxID=28454 RepID=UPI00289EB0BA|nr:hypothetical protein [Sphingobacterium multivorum]